MPVTSSPLDQLHPDTCEKQAYSLESVSCPPPPPPIQVKAINTPRLRLIPLISQRIGTEEELNEIEEAIEWANANPDHSNNSLNLPTTLWAIKKETTFIGLIELTDDHSFSHQHNESPHLNPETNSLEHDDSDDTTTTTPTSTAFPSPYSQHILDNDDTLDHQLENAVAHLKVKLDPVHAGHGYSTESVKALLQHVFSCNARLRVQSVLRAMDPVKEGAESCLERIGFSVAEHVSPSMKRDGTVVEGWTVWEIERDGFMELWAS
ncbi:hypothetical protein HDU79_008469 [Rhizoclosmatium sp. JEL0117]|nr:hypothetical protein HDU79_008469 [Rhizoclosmatium sp. JEL0117]